jgi:hypothetical protein
MANKEAPRLAAEGNTLDFPDFPKFGVEPFRNFPGTEEQVQWPHPYAHPIIPRYVGAPAYFQQTIPLDESHYRDDVWYDKQVPPIHVTVSANHPNPETYSHHHFYFDQQREPGPLENGILTNVV